MLTYPIDGTLIKPDNAASLRKPNSDTDLDIYKQFLFDTAPSSTSDKFIIPYSALQQSYTLRGDIEEWTSHSIKKFEIEEFISKITLSTPYIDFPKILRRSKCKKSPLARPIDRQKNNFFSYLKKKRLSDFDHSNFLGDSIGPAERAANGQTF